MIWAVRKALWAVVPVVAAAAARAAVRHWEQRQDPQAG